MKISEISFGRKIPITICKLKDIRQDKFIDAEICEYDCFDKSDIEEVQKTKGNWFFLKPFIKAMEEENYLKNKGNIIPKYHFYTVEAFNKILGFAQVSKERPKIKIEYLESDPDKKYKYVGQSLMKMISEMGIDEIYEKIYVPVPVKDACDFYKKCGFKEVKRANSLELSRFGMHRMKRKKTKID